MEARLTSEVPAGDGWQFEPKWDGFRALVFRDGDEILIQSRDEKRLSINRTVNRKREELAEFGGVNARRCERCFSRIPVRPIVVVIRGQHIDLGGQADAGAHR